MANVRRRARRNRVALVLGVLLLLLPIVMVSQAGALDTTNPPALTFVSDENGADDQPGQKDLSAHAVATPSAGDLWVAWKWDVTSLSGGNTGDACALFDTDTDSKVNFAVCVTIGGNPAAQLTALSPRIYTCGDAKVDRCTSTAALVPKPYATACSVNQSGVSNSDPFHSGQTDTVALCHVALSDVGGAGTANLVNTCSYPSEQPNSDPSDCVLIPRDAFIRIVKDANPNAGSFPFRLDGTVVFTASGDQTSQFFAIRSDQTHTVKEDVPTGWEITGTPSCTGASGSGSSNGTYSGANQTISGIDASPDNQITCTFNDRQRASVNVTKTGNDSGAQTGAIFTLYTGANTSGTVIGTCTVAASGQCGSNPSFSNLVPGQYTIDETTVPSGYNKAANLPHTFTLAAGQALTLSFENAAQPGSAAVTKLDDAGNGVANAVFKVYSPDTIVNGAPTGVEAGSCTTNASGTCTISNLAPGSYAIDETTVPSGYAKDSSFPKTITITRGNTLQVSATDPRQFKAIVIVCRQHDSKLYPSAITIDGNSAGSSLSAAQATTAGLSESALCALTAGAASGLRSANHASNPHSAGINIPNAQP